MPALLKLGPNTALIVIYLVYTIHTRRHPHSYSARERLPTIDGYPSLIAPFYPSFLSTSPFLFVPRFAPFIFTCLLIGAPPTRGWNSTEFSGAHACMRVRPAVPCQANYGRLSALVLTSVLHFTLPRSHAYIHRFLCRSVLWGVVTRL